MARTAKRRSRDYHAAALIEEMCESRGWSPADLADATERVAQRLGEPRYAACRRTMDRGLDGHIPIVRIKAGICFALSTPEQPLAPWNIWGQGAMPLARDREMRPAA